MKSRLLTIAVLSIALVMFGSQAKADIIDFFMGFPTPLPFTQQDKTYADFTDANGNFNNNNTTAIKTQTFLTYDQHTVSFDGIFSANTTYDILYTIEVNTTAPAGYSINEIASGIDQTGNTLATLRKRAWSDAAKSNLVYDSGVITDNASNFVSVGFWSKLWIEDLITTTEASSINSVSNSFIEGTRPVPEPATMLLLGAGLLGVAVIRRKKD